MRHPDRLSPFRHLAVVDVDLDAGTAIRVPSVTKMESAPEGVHALVWLHDEPIGEITLVGVPELLLPTLPDKARELLAREICEHLLMDALSAKDCLELALDKGLTSVTHPVTGPRDGSAVTVAVCTRDRPEALRHCLTAIGALRTPVAEVLVVDNASSDDRTRQVTEEFPVRYVHEPRQGLDWARNRALLEASTPLVAFADDDVLVHPRWIDGVLRVFDEEPDALVVTGLVAPAEFSTPAQVMFEAQGGFGRGYKRKWMAVASHTGEVAARTYPGTGGIGTGANMALRRQEVLDLGGFDPALDVGTLTGGGGDLEMYFRVVAAGALVVYEPTAVVRHLHRRTMQELMVQMRGNGTGSYSIYVGAGLHYDKQRTAFTLFALRWAYGHVRRRLRSALVPQVLPPDLIKSEFRGMVDAVVHRYYHQARSQAAHEAKRHPAEPSAGPLVRVAPSASSARTADPVLDLDLQGLADGGGLHAPAESRPGRRVRLRLRRDGEDQAIWLLVVGGLWPSAARLRAAAVEHLGPAVLWPGTTWREIAGQLDAKPRAGREPMPDVRGGQAAEPTLSVSVLIATRGRPDDLEECLAALHEHTAWASAEIVVVDNSDDPERTRTIASEQPRVRVLHEPRPGSSRARNAGLSQIDSDIVVFVDDDVVVTRSWLRELLAPFADPSVTAVTGNVLPRNADNLEAQIFEDYGGLGRGPSSTTFDREWLQASRGPARTWLIGATANAAIRREALTRLGPFTETLGAGRPAGVGEDTEYFYRILRSGGTIAYSATAIVRHRHRDSRDALRTQLRGYSAGHVAYHLEILRKYRDVRGLPWIFYRQPRDHVRQAFKILVRGDDYPPRLLAAQITGCLDGIPAWLRSRWSARR